MVGATFENPQFEPEDDEIVLLGCRRITVDWVLRRHLEANTDCEYRDGMAVDGLLAEHDTASGLPRVLGVRFAPIGEAQQELMADLVVDATGRNSKLPGWLAAIGSDPLEQESNSCGIFYCSRFYRLRDGVEPPAMEGSIAGDLGYMKYAIFPGDSRIFSITMAAASDDKSMLGVRKPGPFQAAAEALYATRAWVDPAVSEPITEVYTYANLNNTLRLFVNDNQPLVLGLFPIGDALAHANPMTGRGCALAWLAAYMLSDAFTEHPDDALTFAQDLHAEIVSQLVPWYVNIRDADLAAAEVKQIEEAGGDPLAFEREDGSIDPKAYMRSVMRHGLIPALRTELPVLRASMRVFNMLDLPSDLLANADLLQRVMAKWQQREEHEPIRRGPDREEMLERLLEADS